jgi:hypothetical protein
VLKAVHCQCEISWALVIITAFSVSAVAILLVSPTAAQKFGERLVRHARALRSYVDEFGRDQSAPTLPATWVEPKETPAQEDAEFWARVGE